MRSPGSKQPLASLIRWCPLLIASLAILAPAAETPVYAHRHTAPWLDESSLEGGLWVTVAHPRVIRQPGSFTLSVMVNNLLGEQAVTVQEVRYRGPGLNVVHPRGEVLESKRSAYRRYQESQRELRDSAADADAAAAERLYEESQSQLVSIVDGAFDDRQEIPAALVPRYIGAALDLAVEIDVHEGERTRTIRRELSIPVQPPLPAGAEGDWVAGDQHLHTAFSIDAFFLDGTVELISDYAATAQVLDLDWIITTDHTNVRFLLWYQPWMHSLGEAMAADYREQQQYLVLQGQEMGAGSLGRFGEPAHLLVYPRQVASTGFLANPCSGLIFNHVNCEPEQVILDRVNGRGGIGFIAHPFSEGTFTFAPWDRESDVVGWAGLEIFNSGSGNLDANDERSIAWWHELLSEIEPPQHGELAERPGYPTRFPVGLGNSDAHHAGQIGATFTYARLPGHHGGMVSREALMGAFADGRCVASNGPLLFAKIHGAGIGDVARLPAHHNRLAVTLHTTAEFGPVADYQITVLVDGSARTVLRPSSESDFSTSLTLENLLHPPDRYVTLRAERIDCPACPPGRAVSRALTNPIWLEFRPGERCSAEAGCLFSDSLESGDLSRWSETTL